MEINLIWLVRKKKKKKLKKVTSKVKLERIKVQVLGWSVVYEGGKKAQRPQSLSKNTRAFSPTP